MSNANENKTLTDLKYDLIEFLKAIKSSPNLQEELRELAKLIATRQIPNNQKEKAKIAFLLSLIFIGVYPELKTPVNRRSTINYLAKLL